MLAFRLGAPALAACLCSLPSAQAATAVSPAQTATVEGNSSNAFPWNSPSARRYTQIHSDLPPGPLSITKLSFRGNAGNTTNYLGVRVCDVELSMGSSVEWDEASFVFANNYIGAPTIVVARRIVNVGPLGQNTVNGPLPFTVFIPLDAPYVHSGVHSLVWDAAVYSNPIQTGSGSFNQIDAENCSGLSGTSTITGTGCIATGRTTTMTHTLGMFSRGDALLVGPTVSNGPTSAATVLALGTSNPNLPFPGLCGNVFTDLLAIIDLGTTRVDGAIGGDNGLGWVFPNFAHTGAITSQAVSVDVGQTNSLPLSVSNGRLTRFPAPDTSNVVKVSRIYNLSGGPSGTLASPILPTSIGYGIVTEFTY